MPLRTFANAIFGSFLTLVTFPAGSLEAQNDPVLQVLNAFHLDGQFDGTALVYRDRTQTIRQGFGLANIEEGVANSPDTRFAIASITKAFTATLALQLAQDGKWSLDSTVGKHLPEIASAEVEGITLRQLLEHSSGVVRDHTEYFPSSRQELGFDDLIQVLNSAPLLFEPGDRHSFSNSGYVLLRYAIERVSGKTYEVLLRDSILAPLGMKATGVLSSADAGTDLAQGYSTWLITEPSPGRPRNGANGDMLGADGLYSTVNDLWRFVRGIEDRQILENEGVALLWPPQGPGLGWEILELPSADGKSTRVILTTGASPRGFLSAIAWLPADHGGFVVLTNNDAPGRVGFPSLLTQMESALQGETRPPEIPETPIRDVLQALFADGIDAALAEYRTLDRPDDTRAQSDAAQAAGAPDAPPGETPFAWASLTPNDRPEWLELWYNPPVEATEVRVYETQVPGAINTIETRSVAKKRARIDVEERIQTVSDRGVPVSVIPLPSGPAIEYLTLHLDAAGVPGWTQIDAVGLVETSGHVHWATGARASSSAADGVPPPIHAYPSAHVLEDVARAYREASRIDEARLILGFAGRTRQSSTP